MTCDITKVQQRAFALQIHCLLPDDFTCLKSSVLIVSLRSWKCHRDITGVRSLGHLPCKYPADRQPKKSRTAGSWIFLGLVAIARAKHPVPSRTRKLSAFAPMVLRLKAWESRSLPNLVKSKISKTITLTLTTRTNRPQVQKR